MSIFIVFLDGKFPNLWNIFDPMSKSSLLKSWIFSFENIKFPVYWALIFIESIKGEIKLSEKCERLHFLFNDLKRHSYNTDYADYIPENGIYVMFEKGENAHQTDRIVRIGTHDGQNQMKSRLKQHISANGRSVFRTKIGAAIINKSILGESSIWSEEDLVEWNKTKWGEGIPRRRERFKKMDRSKQFEEADRMISEYIGKNISFVCVEIADKNDRKLFEARLISTISNCTECKKTEHWFGNFCTKPKVRDSGLWQENELWKSDFSDSEFAEFERIIEVSRKKYG